MLGSLAAIAVILVGGFFALRDVATQEAERDTRERVLIEGKLIEAAGLEDGVLTGDPRALAKLDDLVQGQILGESVVRVKVWSQDGTILYSDEPRLIGQRFALGEEEAELFETGGSDAELSDLGEPENRYERAEGKLLEAHTAIRTPDKTQVLFEIYQRFSSINASATEIVKTLAPPVLAGLLVLLLFQAPLAWRLARNLQRGHEERERLLAGAIEASDRERRRIASDLHDGVVQDLAGVAFGLAPLAADARRRGNDEEARVIDDAVDTLRQGVRDMRTLLVEIHPPRLETAGLEPVLHDLLSPLRKAGIETHLSVEEEPAAKELVYRVAGEALRNVLAHAQASRVDVTVTPTTLTVADDGRGFDAAERASRAEDGHVGLSLLTDLVAQSGGQLAVRSVPGTGTTVTLELAP
ncbi:histidine kinase/DNA gyrase B/HSP90-like ATPase [Solirubrobacter pauli]|uniref:Histidine kinase/DNA gyrase B/HSP90-like ATPase n=2 Tax=Solirubrobacter pauli TaxID=166793 RepID=A0A660KY56_9ACTN|nr:histidine kinase/DNA gyrase B/HSP90-like ATPase [Solirubrobacter pauli]